MPNPYTFEVFRVRVKGCDVINLPLKSLKCSPLDPSSRLRTPFIIAIMKGSFEKPPQLLYLRKGHGVFKGSVSTEVDMITHHDTYQTLPLLLRMPLFSHQVIESKTHASGHHLDMNHHNLSPIKNSSTNQIKNKRSQLGWLFNR